MEEKIDAAIGESATTVALDDNSANNAVTDSELDKVQEVTNLDAQVIPADDVTQNVDTNNSAEDVTNNDTVKRMDAHTAAKFLDKPLETIRTWRKKNKLPAEKINGVYYFLESDVYALKKKLDAEKAVNDTSTADDKVDETSDSQVDSVSTSLINVTMNAPQSIETLTVEIKFYLQTFRQSIIEVGKRLIQAKKLVPHGQWQNWLEHNFELSQNTAGRFMQVYERFGKSATSQNLNQSQMITLLALPEGDEQKFVDEKAAEGKNVSDMTIKTLRAEIARWKDRAKKDNDEIVSLKEKVAQQLTLFETHDETIKNLTTERDNLAFEKKSLSRLLDIAEKEINGLREKPVEVAIETPADYETTKQELAKLKERDKNFQRASAVCSKLEHLDEIASYLCMVNKKILLSAIKNFISVKDESAFLDLLQNISNNVRKLENLYTENDIYDDETGDNQ